MAYSISGFCRDSTNEIITTECYYQFYFLKQHNGSSDSVWSDIYQTVNGYFSKDILDGDMQGSKGKFHKDDYILVCVWYGDSTRSTAITHCMDFVHQIVDVHAEVIDQDIQILPIQAPIGAHFYGLPSTGNVDTDYLLVNDSSTVFSVTLGTQYHDETLYQHCEFLSESIFPPCCIKESHWDFDDSTTVVYTGLADATHQWSSPGTYDVRLTIENYFGLTDYFEQIINIGYTPVVAEFMYNPDPGVWDDPVTFTNLTLDPDSRVGTHSNGKYYRWEIYDGDVLAPPTNIYEGDFALSPVHIFINGPDRCAILYAYWNDGTSDQVSQVTHCVPFQPVADFDKITTSCAPRYRDTSVAGVPPKTYYWWSILEETPTGWNEIFALEGPDVFEIKYHFPNAGTYRVYHKVRDSGNLEDDEIKTYVMTECPCGPEKPPGDVGQVSLPGGGPGVGEKPRIRVKLIDTEQEKKKFNIGLTFSYVEEKKET